jgi:transposase InsO family protein
MSVEKGIGRVAAACRALGLSRSSYYRSGRSSLESRRIRKEVLELSGKHPRYGYRRITVLMRREGFEVNTKRVARIRREEGVSEHLRSDNGPEFIASCIQDWLMAQEIKTLYIKPGSPWENGHIESFHDKLRMNA